MCMCVGGGGLVAGCSGRRILLNCPGVISGRGCVTRETAGTLWKSNAYISHLEQRRWRRRRASFCFHPFFYYRTRALSPFLVLFTFRVSRSLLLPARRISNSFSQECAATAREKKTTTTTLRGWVGSQHLNWYTVLFMCSFTRCAP